MSQNSLLQPYLCLSVSPSIHHLPTYLFICLSVLSPSWLSVTHLPTYLPAYPSIHPPTYPPTNYLSLPACPSVCLSVHLSITYLPIIYLPIYLSTCLSITYQIQ